MAKDVLVVGLEELERDRDVVGTIAYPVWREGIVLYDRALALPVPLADLAPLNRYAVEARYPIGDEPLTGDEARAAISLARRVREVVLGSVGSGSPSA